MPRGYLLTFSAGWIWAALTACAGSNLNMSGEPVFGKNAEEDYGRGEREFRDHSYVDAGKYFEHLKNKYPFSAYAPLAELRLADSKFAEEKYVDAAEAYRSFARLHPTHDQADYAALRVGVSKLRGAPGNFFLFPPAYEKDQSEVGAAVIELEEFIATHPESSHLPEAQTLLMEARTRLADHEWYVAQFYRKRSRWPAVIGRLNGMLKMYPGTRYDAEALYQLADAYLKINERYRAQQALQALVAKHPNDPLRPSAEAKLEELR